MCNLEEEIAGWRRRMAAGGVTAPAVLDELEGHLREEIRSRIKGGAAADQAFREALAQMGSADSLRDEFNKVDSGGRVFMGSLLLWLGLAGWVAVYCGRRLQDGRAGPLLTTHTFTLTMGYLAAFLAGGMAAAYVCAQWVDGTSPTLKHRLVSGSARFVDFAAAFIVVGFVLGLLWSDHRYGRYWIKSVREIGALVALTGIIVLSAVSRIRRLTEETQVLLGLVGSLVVGLAWFSLPLVARRQPLGSSWVLDVFVGFHLLLIALNFVRRQKPVLS